MTALNTGGDAHLDSLSCGSAGNCAAGGDYSGSGPQAFVVTEKNGTWGKAIEVPGLTALNADPSASVNSVSCASAGNCAAVGSYRATDGLLQAFVVSQNDGTWGKAIEVPGSGALNAGGNADVESVFCGSAGNCAAGGEYLDSSSHQQAFVVSENSGTWGQAIEVPGSAALNTGGFAQIVSVSCTSAGYCAAGGDYSDSSGNQQPFVVSRT